MRSSFRTGINRSESLWPGTRPYLSVKAENVISSPSNRKVVVK